MVCGTKQDNLLTIDQSALSADTTFAHARSGIMRTEPECKLALCESA